MHLYWWPKLTQEVTLNGYPRFISIRVHYIDIIAILVVNNNNKNVRASFVRRRFWSIQKVSGRNTDTFQIFGSDNFPRNSLKLLSFCRSLPDWLKIGYKYNITHYNRSFHSRPTITNAFWMFIIFCFRFVVDTFILNQFIRFRNASRR